MIQVLKLLVECLLVGEALLEAHDLALADLLELRHLALQLEEYLLGLQLPGHTSACPRVNGVSAPARQRRGMGTPVSHPAKAPAEASRARNTLHVRLPGTHSA